MSDPLKYARPIISIDVEDWPQSSWDRSQPIRRRAADNALRVLELLSRLGVRATAFVLGKFAEAFPGVVREFDAAGHEIASHGYGHVEVFANSRAEFVADVKRSKFFLEQTIGKPVRGYRAPDFSIVRGTLWALEELAAQGFEYDSSVFPVTRPRYGIAEWPLEPARVRLASGQSILEFPIGTYRVLGRNWPVGGGGYNRLLPGFATRWFAKSVMRSRPFVFYCHPYEFDPREFDDMEIAIPKKVRLHQGLGRSRVEGRFVKLIETYGGCRMVDMVDARAWREFRLESLVPPFEGVVAAQN